MRFLTITALALAMTGCATNPSMYQWGGYDQALYSSYKDATKTESMRLKLESHITAMEQSKQKVAPGLYAELGTLYLQSGASDTALGFYKRERNTWPESTGLMTAMIENIVRRNVAKTEVQK